GLAQDAANVGQHLVDLLRHVAFVQRMPVIVTGGLARREQQLAAAADPVGMYEAVGFLPGPGVDDLALHRLSPCAVATQLLAWASSCTSVARAGGATCSWFIWASCSLARAMR